MSNLLGEPSTFRDTLYTIDRRGRRHWVYPSLVRGRYFIRRSVVAYTLLLIYLSGPWIKIRGNQAFLFDVVHRKFVIAGVEFWATDTLFLMLTLAILGICLFFFTALVGRVWCGWACPQTVYLEFLFRPIERIIEGGPAKRLRLDSQPWGLEKLTKKTLKISIFAFCSWAIANTFLAYLYGADRVLQMMQHSPSENPFAFGINVVVMAAFLFEFAWFREQFCTVLCPYARFQSVMLDEHSLVIGYDSKRGEPRGKLRSKTEGKGDCVDCGACVRVCPTGIDIRNGLQLECINCAGCIDACDEIMKSIGKPPGLIRYDSEAALQGNKLKLFRPRIALYSAVLSILLGLFLWSLSIRRPFDADIIRRPMSQTYFPLPDGRISNPFFATFSNKTRTDLTFSISLETNLQDVEIIIPGGSLVVPAGKMETLPIMFNFTQSILVQGKKQVSVVVSAHNPERKERDLNISLTLMGPDK